MHIIYCCQNPKISYILFFSFSSEISVGYQLNTTLTCLCCLIWLKSQPHVDFSIFQWDINSILNLHQLDTILTSFTLVISVEISITCCFFFQFYHWDVSWIPNVYQFHTKIWLNFSSQYQSHTNITYFFSIHLKNTKYTND